MTELTIFAGHYGSGKTNIAVNYALHLRRTHPRVLLCDLDIVNPYFRTADAADLLRANDVTLVASPYANSNLESPALPSNLNAVFDAPDAQCVLDVGGDDRGMMALGRYANNVKALPHKLLLVTNCYRPLARTVPDTQALIAEMEQAAHLRFTGLVNNANLGASTRLQDIQDSRAYIEALSQATNLPLVMTCLRADLAPQWPHGNAFPLSIIGNRFHIDPAQ